MSKEDVGILALIIIAYLLGAATIFMVAQNKDECDKTTNHNISIYVSLSEGSVKFIQDIITEFKLPPKVEPKKKEYEVYEPKIVPCQLSTGKPPVISEPDHIVLEGNETDPQFLATSSASLSETSPRKAPPASSRKTSASGKRPRSRSKQ